MVRARYRNCTTAGSIPARGPIVAFFATTPGLKCKKFTPEIMNLSKGK
jgi:hypothetical protein